MRKNTLLLILFLLGFSSAKAQYLGGPGDGHAMAETSNIVLSNNEVAGIDYAVKIYPNPAKPGDEIMLMLSGLQHVCSEVKIYNMQGVEVYKAFVYNAESEALQLQAKHFSRGIYMVKITGNSYKAVQRKLVIL